MSKQQITVLASVLVLIGAFFVFDLGQYLTFDYLQQQRQGLVDATREAPLLASLVLIVIYVAVTGLSLPGAAVMTLAAGAIFGFFWGLVLVSIASTIGATIAMLVSRVLLRDWVQKRFSKAFRTIDKGVEKDGAFYLFTLRMVPLFPFFVINMVMGLTNIRVLPYFFVSQVGMLAGTAVYVFAGTQLAQLTSLSGVLSPGILIAFILLGLSPFLARFLMDRIRTRRLYASFHKPALFDSNMVIIGAGSGGLVAAIIGSTLKAGVTLVERGLMGGDCLNTGCVPSKTLIRSARINALIGRAAEFGINASAHGVDFPRVMARVRSVIAAIAPKDSMERYRSLGVDCIAGSARIVDPFRVEVTAPDGAVQTLRTASIVIATGGSPMIPPIPGLKEMDYLTSDTIWDLTELPSRLLVMGGGPIGCELAQAFARLGARVTLIDMLERILPREDPDVSEAVTRHLREEGIEVLTGHRAESFDRQGEQQTLHALHGDQPVQIAFDQVLVAVGRRAATENLGLEELGIEVNPDGTVQVNEYLQSRLPNITVCGDAAGPYQFTHMASHQAWYAAVHALFGWIWRFRVNYKVVPWTTYVDPEVARVGINETEAREQALEFEVTRYDLDDLDRALAEGETRGFVKVITEKGRDRILGATIVGAHAGELISEYVLAMTHGLGLKKIMGTIHVYPTLAEANKFAASTWRKAHAPDRLLGYVGRFFSWRRGDGSLAAILKETAEPPKLPS